MARARKNQENSHKKQYHHNMGSGASSHDGCIPTISKAVSTTATAASSSDKGIYQEENGSGASSSHDKVICPADKDEEESPRAPNKANSPKIGW
jgi:hypothetical protein